MAEIETHNELSIGSFNTSGVPRISKYIRERYDVLPDKVGDVQVDVFNLQEIHSLKLIKKLRRQLETDYPYAAYKRSPLGIRGGVVTLSRHPIDQVHFHSYGRPRKRLFRLLPITIPGREKGALATTLQDSSLVVINTHLTANTQGEWTPGNPTYNIQKKQLEYLTGLVRRSSRSDHVTIVTGDFNIPKGHELYERFVADTHVQDTFGQSVHPTFRKEYLPAGRQPQCIDYIFFHAPKEAVTVKSTQLVFQEPVGLPDGTTTYLSDHIGILATLEFPGIRRKHSS